MATLIGVIHQQNGDASWGSDHPGVKSPDVFISLDELKDIEENFVIKLRSTFKENLMSFSQPDITEILFRWNKLQPNDPELSEAIDRFWSDDDQIIMVIHDSYSKNYDDTIKPYTLEPFKTYDEFREKVKQLLDEKEDLSQDITHSLKEFIHVENYLNYHEIK